MKTLGATTSYTILDEIIDELGTLAYELGEFISQADTIVNIIENTAERLRQLQQDKETK